MKLESPVFKTFRCQKAADSLDINSEEKARHELSVFADLKTPYHIGLILGASGSGKTTLAKAIFGNDCFDVAFDASRPVIEQFPEKWTYDECAAALAGIGLTAAPCWIRPMATLSNGQKARAEAALLMSQQAKSTICIDEWTSVVDRTVAKVMCHCLQKYARKSRQRVVVLSCHYDVVDWLNPDWVIDCNKQDYLDRRSMVGTHKRSDQLCFTIREVERESWKYFSKYHYLSKTLPGGKIYNFGLFHGNNQIGFQCFAAYIIGDMQTYFSNRTVIHPDYAGLGLGIILINETSKIMVKRGFKVKAKFSSTPIYRSMVKNELWKCTKINKPIKKQFVGKVKNKSEKESLIRSAKIRSKVTTYHFDFVWRERTDDKLSSQT